MLRSTAGDDPVSEASARCETSESLNSSPAMVHLIKKRETTVFPISDQPFNTASEFFRGKRVLMISPQVWDFIHVSKHHYTKEIARSASKVFFLEPPLPHAAEITVTSVPENETISVVRCRATIPRWVRFKANWLYQMFLRRHIHRLRSKLGELDVVWCFEPNLYPRPELFGGNTTLYHVVDPVPYQRQVEIGGRTDAVVSVSPKIIKRFEGITPDDRRLVVNHGLSEVFLKPHAGATDNTVPQGESSTVQDGVIRFGYCGNLTRPQIDHSALMRIIGDHPRFEFHFWGPYENTQGGSQQDNFVQFLKASDNVVLHGQVPTETLAFEIQRMSGFLLAYRADNVETDNSNSHKILEYLSTGKVIVSKPIEFYQGSPLLEVAADDSTESYVKTFREVSTRLYHFNGPELFTMRKTFAATQTYASQLDRIVSFLMNLQNVD
ncbi:MAG: glycosyltransferase family 4 protein [Fuerstiella sp.]|nr:glycosyltransferase family 4 protein [Fuerstiella sp.]MCP4858882.1 glycosyltransferase family 4 protein [Fuerstiella sp.]